MRAAVLEKLNSPLRIETDLEIPTLKSGQVLVKIAYSGVCHSQLMEASGGRGEDRYLPHLLGHEGSGTVIDVGTDVRKVKKNDRVILGWIKGKGAETGGVQYRSGSRMINAGAVTTFNEFAVVSENRCTLLPEGLPMDVAVLFGCAVLTGAGMVMNTIQPKPGSKLAIFGAGGVGLNAVMATKLFDCSEVIVVDVADDKLALARELGATKTINARNQDPVEAIRAMTDGQGVDASVDSAGFVKTIEQAFDSVKKSGGLCVFASHPKSGDKISLNPHDLLSGKRIQGSWGGASEPDRDIERLAELYRAGKLPLEKLLTRRYSLEQVNEALEDLAKGLVARPLLEIDRAR